MTSLTRFACVIRIWQEAPPEPDGRAAVLRGSLQMVDSGAIFYFTSLEQIPSLLRSAASQLRPNFSPQEQTP